MKLFKFLIAILAATLIFHSCKKDESFANDLIDSSEPELLKRSCSMQDHMDRLLLDPSYKKQHENKFRKLEAFGGRKFSLASNTILPLAIHFQGVSNPDITCLRTLAQSQVDILNNDYRGTNADINQWTNNAASSFPGIANGAAAFKFCLANKNHPSGYSLSEGDPAVTVNATNGDSDANWSGYINIFVQYNTGVLGYSPLGGSGNGDGVVIDASAFGTGAGCGSIKPDAPFNLGRTLTHELGHYLLLDHIWGGGCGQDDEVADTPDSQQEYYDCPNIGATSCGSTDMHMNYMDYTNDACMYMFSEGQVTRSTNYVASSLSSVISNAANVCSEDSDGGDNGGGDNGGGDNGGGDNGGEDPVSGCAAPVTIEIGEVDGSSAVLSWPAIGDANNYRIRFRAEGSNTWYSLSTASNQFTLSSLAAETVYEFQVKSICTAENGTWSTKQSFRTGNHGCDPTGTCTDTPVFLEIGLDEYGSETTWELRDANNQIVAEGGPYEDGQNGQKIELELCLLDGCYSFEMYDAFGDGICCDYGEGYFQLLNLDGSVIAASDGFFGAFTTVEFCINQSNRTGKRGMKVTTKVGKRDPIVIAQSQASKR